MPQGHHLYGATFGAGQYVAVGEHGALVVSSDAAVWRAIQTGDSSTLRSVAWGPRGFVAVGDGGATLWSGDGLTWTTGAAATRGVTLYGIAASDEVVVAVGEDGTVLYSPRPDVWIRVPMTNDRTFYTVAFNGVAFCAIDSSGGVALSRDGRSWDLHRGGPASMRALTWQGSRWVAAGLQGRVAVSDSGERWQYPDSGTTAVLSGVTAVREAVVAVGDNGTVLTSPDGARWSRVRSGTGARLNDVAWTGRRFVAVGSVGAILTSDDGLAWQRVAPVTDRQLTAS